MYDLLIKNGKIITAAGQYYGDVAVKNEKIEAILAPGAEAEAAKVVDASGKYVLPGAIDLHTHLALPFGGTTSTDDYESGTRGAVCGGTTTVFDYATPENPNETLASLIERRRAMADAQVVADYAFHLVLKYPSEKQFEELPSIIEDGISSFKVYTVYDGYAVDDGFMMQLLEKTAELGGLVCVHAENKSLIDMYIGKYKAEGKLSPWYHYMSRREFIESEADARCIALAKAAGAPLYIVHLGCAGGVEAVLEAKAEGYDIFAETNALYLRFNNEVYKREDGRNFVCSPPMKGEESRLALWEGVADGTIDTIATDHCPFTQAEKDWGLEDFTKIPNGCDGLETRFPYILSEANQGHITFERAIDTCCTRPAELFGCPTKGSIEVGKDADIVIYDPDQEVTVTIDKLHSGIDHTVWEGTELKGYPVMTFVRGTLVYDNGEFLGKAGFGKYLKREIFKG